jgi:hypothetical protein
MGSIFFLVYATKSVGSETAGIAPPLDSSLTLASSARAISSLASFARSQRLPGRA